jgi:hypothetical protein
LVAPLLRAIDVRDGRIVLRGFWETSEQGRFLGHRVSAVTVTTDPESAGGGPGAAVGAQRLGQLGRATEALLDSLDASAGGTYRTPDSLFFADRAASDASIAGMRRHQEEHGFAQWAVEVPGEASLIGAIGLLRVRFRADFAPAVEIGWRLARPYWSRVMRWKGRAPRWITGLAGLASTRSSPSPCPPTAAHGS